MFTFLGKATTFYFCVSRHFFPEKAGNLTVKKEKELKIVNFFRCIVPVQNVQLWEHGTPSRLQYTYRRPKDQKNDNRGGACMIDQRCSAQRSPRSMAVELQSGQIIIYFFGDRAKTYARG